MTTLEVTKEVINLSNRDYSINKIKNAIYQSLDKQLNFFYIGRRSYYPIWKLQQELHHDIKNNELSSVVLFLEHDHVYTFGKNANKDFLLNSYPKEVEVVQSDRGGQITYHGPGQLVGYPIINLNKFKKSVSWYMRSLEEVIIQTLNEYTINAKRKQGMTGVWVEDEKICAMGVRLSRWVTMHGFALNVMPEMSYYDSMIPCGIQEYGITSIYNLIDKEIDMFDISEILSKNFNKIFKEIS